MDTDASPDPPYGDGDALGVSGDCDLDTLDQVAGDLLTVCRPGRRPQG